MYGAFKNRVHYAIAESFKWLICSVINIVIKRMNDEGHNDPHYPEYWMVDNLENLLKFNDQPAHECRYGPAIHEYIRDCFSACAYACEWAGREFNDQDVFCELYEKWSDEMRRCIEIDFMDEWWDLQPGAPLWAEYWSTSPIERRPRHKWKSKGLIYCHEPEEQEETGGN